MEGHFKGGIPDGLTRTQPVLIRSVKINSFERNQHVRIVTDIDGIVLELHKLNNLKFPVRYLSLINEEKRNVKPISKIIRKHLNLKNLTADAIKNLSSCLGYQMFYEYGWEARYSLVPIEGREYRFMSPEMIEMVSLNHFFKIRNVFRKLLRERGLQGLSLNTIAKHDLSTLEKITLSSDDGHVIMGLFQAAIDSINPPTGLRKCIVLYRFGEKSTAPLSLEHFHLPDVAKLTLHVAANIGLVPDIDVLWSTTGLQNLIGTRGTLLQTLCLQECSNFQSSMDGRELDISHELRSVFSRPGHLQFLQMYADLPHLVPSTWHPTSTLIAAGSVLHPQTVKALEKHSLTYISCMTNNFTFFNKSVARLEGVVAVDPTADTLKADDFIRQDVLMNLLERYNLLVPFQNLPSAKPFLNIMSEVGQHLAKTLYNLRNGYMHTGNARATVTAYQAEIALERILWGHTLTNKSDANATVLGPGNAFRLNSRTHRLGFLALESITPDLIRAIDFPITIWTVQNDIISRLQRLYGMHDNLDKPIEEVGKDVMLRLLRDLWETGKPGLVFTEFLEALQGKSSFQVNTKGAVSFNALTDILSTPRRVPYPMIFGKVIEILQANDMDVQDTIKHGLSELQMKYFPALQLYDKHRNQVINWRKEFQYWKIEEEDSTEASDFSLTQLVMVQLEEKELVHASKVRKITTPWPWIPQVRKKLKNLTLTQDEMVDELTFVTCIVLVMNGWFVNYAGLAVLEKRLKFKQFHLRDCEILARYALKENQRFYRLHKSISREMKVVETTSSTVPPIQAQGTRQEGPIEEPFTHTEEAVLPQLVSSPEPMTVPNTKKKWDQKELAIIEELRSNPTIAGSTYAEYKKMCFSRGVPVRSYMAFQKKIARL